MNITISTTSTLVAAHIGKVSAATGSAYKGIAISFLIEEVKRQMRQGICQDMGLLLLPRCPCRRGEEFPLGKFGGGFVIVEEGGASSPPPTHTPTDNSGQIKSVFK